ncbi:MAG TPA: DUF3800 domain-containing protein [Acidimicrobiales bacterium]|nr:DUF3800 domain-containing protein [Acidimicrobiales bacterium]
MARVYVFGDEAGNLDFKVAKGASKYFIVCSVTMPDCGAGDDLMELRRELAWQGVALESTFHATEDKQVVRDEVFRLLADVDLRVDATILEKRKALPRLQQDKEHFYKFAWYYHFKHVAPRIASSKDELLVVIASIGTKKRRKGIRLGIEDVIWQSSRTTTWEVAFWPAESDPCLQIADYCTWAVQRKWEANDDRSYQIIKPKIRSEYNLWSAGTTYYY